MLDRYHSMTMKSQVKISTFHAFKQDSLYFWMKSVKQKCILQLRHESLHKFHIGQSYKNGKNPSLWNTFRGEKKNSIQNPDLWPILWSHSHDWTDAHFSVPSNFTKTFAMKNLCKLLGTLVSENKVAVRASWMLHMLIFYIISRKFN